MFTKFTWGDLPFDGTSGFARRLTSRKQCRVILTNKKNSCQYHRSESKKNTGYIMKTAIILLSKLSCILLKNNNWFPWVRQQYCRTTSKEIYRLLVLAGFLYGIHSLMGVKYAKKTKLPI